jgi:hypothetical protein
MAIAVAGCGADRPRMAPLPQVAGRAAPIEDARALLAELRRRDDAHPAWKSVHRLTLQDRRNARHAKMRGLLVVARPDRFRLRLLGPADVTAMDLTYVAPRYRLEIAGRDTFVGADARRETRLPVAAMAETFLRRFEGEAVGLWAGSTRRRLAIATPDGGRRIVILPAARPEVMADSFRRRGVEELRVTYRQYRSVGPARLPFEVSMYLPDRSLAAHVAVERYEVGPAIPEGAFEIP